MTFDSPPTRHPQLEDEPAASLGGPAPAQVAPPVAAAEAEIWRALTSGRHATAVELTLTTYGAALHRLARRMVGDPSTAEDVLQDAFLQIHQGLHTVRSGTSVRAWAMSVVAHRALDELRRRRRRGRLGDEAHAADTPDGAAPASEALATRQECLLVQECVRALPPRIHAAVVLYFGQGLTFAQVGALLREDGGTVQVRVARALTRLQRQLRRRGIDGY